MLGTKDSGIDCPSDFSKIYLIGYIMNSMPANEPKVITLMEKYIEKNTRIPIIVEGKNDVNSLRRINFAGEIIPVNLGSSLLNFSENIANLYDEVIILTDFDRKGRLLKENLVKYLNGAGSKADTYLWEYLLKMSPISTVEELPSEINRVIENWTSMPKNVPQKYQTTFK